MKKRGQRKSRAKPINQAFKIHIFLPQDGLSFAVAIGATAGGLSPALLRVWVVDDCPVEVGEEDCPRRHLEILFRVFNVELF